MPPGSGDVAGIIGVIGPQRAVTSLDDMVGGRDDAGKRRTQRFVERILERRCRVGGRVRIPFLPADMRVEPGEAALFVEQRLGIDGQFGPAAAWLGALTVDPATSRERGEQWHRPVALLDQAEQAGQRSAGHRASIESDEASH